MAHLNSEIFMVNRIDNVTTKTGDDGTTSLSDGKRYPKSHERIELVGTLDEANSAIGMLLTLLPKKATADRKFLTRIQSRLFDVGAVVAGGKAGNYWAAETVKVDQEINQLNQALDPLAEFTLPGGNLINAQAHIARTIVRRAERCYWKSEIQDLISAPIGKYLNRISDYLFVISRTYIDEEILWEPHKG